jgi:hypothetical protein
MDPMATASLATAQKPANAQVVTCRHRWRIDEPDGPRSLGICQRCGSERMFTNWDADMRFSEVRMEMA